jgi:Asp-tRNA(Asn)/Glu-tRNA(Gln) amidotransferase A subunit family amidase
VNAVLDRTVETMTAAGATVVRIRIPDFDALTRNLGVMTMELQPAFDRYLAGLGPAAPVKTFAEYVARREFPPSLRETLEAGLAITDGPSRPEYREQLRRRGALRQALMTAIASHRLDALLYPHQRRLVVPLGEDQVERNGVLSNGTGFPALTFPGGMSAPTATAPLGVPVGVELLGPEWSEPILLRLAFAYEQMARVRKLPASTPALR